jgi:hypothetical protein
MQVTGMKDGSLGRYDGALDAMRQILRKEGVAGMYRGLWPNLRACRFSSSFLRFALGVFVRVR